MKRAIYIAGPSGPDGEKPWKLTKDGDVLGYFDRQKHAVDAGVTTCRMRWKQFGDLAELQIRKRDGKIRDTRTYGRDPRGTKG